MTLSNITRTAVSTLICRAVESESKNSNLHDPIAVQILETLLSSSSEEDKKWILKWKKRYGGFWSDDRRQGIERVNKFDKMTKEYVSQNNNCHIINLGCGLDTMYWRNQFNKRTYIELDLPEIIKLKKEILGNQIPYEMIACSVLDTKWLDTITESGNSNFLFIAQGLLYYLPREGVVHLFKTISDRVIKSEIFFDLIPRFLTRGLFEWLENLVFGITFTFSVKNESEIESFANGLKVTSFDKAFPFQYITVNIN
jgi:O-methyltransferase involved in polyketide biosynthesis